MSDPMWIPLSTGIDEDPFQNLKIYPNPTPGLFTLEMDNPIMGDLIIDIFGESGSKIINIKFLKEINHFSTQIDLSEQPGGVYLIGLMLEKYRASRSNPKHPPSERSEHLPSEQSEHLPANEVRISQANAMSTSPQKK